MCNGGRGVVNGGVVTRGGGGGGRLGAERLCSGGAGSNSKTKRKRHLPLAQHTCSHPFRADPTPTLPFLPSSHPSPPPAPPTTTTSHPPLPPAARPDLPRPAGQVPGDD